MGSTHSSPKVSPKENIISPEITNSKLGSSAVISTIPAGNFVTSNQKNTNFSSPGHPYVFIPSTTCGITSHNDRVVYLSVAAPKNEESKHLYFIDSAEGQVEKQSIITNHHLVQHQLSRTMTPIYIRAESGESNP
jgi:hypothetical protein